LEHFTNDIDACQFIPMNSYFLETENSQKISNTDINNKMRASNTFRNINATKNLDLNSPAKEKCPINLNNYDKKKILNNDDKKINELISIEDEIYNLAFKPAVRSNLFAHGNSNHMQTNAKKWLNNSIHKSMTKPISDQKNQLSNVSGKNRINASNQFRFDNSKLYEQFYNINDNLIKLVRQDLIVQDDQVIFIIYINFLF
jgi:hypothetical protein